MSNFRSMRNILFLFIVIALGAMLATTLELSSSEMAFLWVAITFFAVVTSVTVRAALNAAGQLSFIHILVLMTAAGWNAYGLTFFFSGRNFPAFEALITFGQNLVGLLVVIIIFESLSGRHQRNGKLSWAQNLSRRTQSLSVYAIAAIVILYFGLTLYRFSLGVVLSGTGGVMREVSAAQSAVLQIGSMFSGMVAVIACFMLAGDDAQKRTIGLVLFVLQAALAFLAGRRGLIGLFILLGLIWVSLRGINVRTLLFGLASMFFLFVIAGPIFLMVRGQANQSGIRTVEAAWRGAILAESFSTVADSFSLKSATSEEYLDNLDNRLGFYGWTVEIQQRVHQGWPTRDGEIVWQAVVEVIPRALYPEKLEVLGDLRLEQKIQSWFGMPMEDAASTLLGYGIADGGWLGVVAYFSAFGVILALTFRLMQAANFAVIQYWAVAQLFSLCFNIEAGLTATLGHLRILILAALLESLLRPRTRRGRRGAPGIVGRY